MVWWCHKWDVFCLLFIWLLGHKSKTYPQTLVGQCVFRAHTSCTYITLSADFILKSNGMPYWSNSFVGCTMYLIWNNQAFKFDWVNKRIDPICGTFYSPLWRKKNTVLPLFICTSITLFFFNSFLCNYLSQLHGILTETLLRWAIWGFILGLGNNNYCLTTKVIFYHILKFS